MKQNLMTVTEAAEYLSVSPRTLTKWRSDKSVNLPFKKIGRACRYSRSELDSYLDANTVNAMAS